MSKHADDIIRVLEEKRAVRREMRKLKMLNELNPRYQYDVLGRVTGFARGAGSGAAGMTIKSSGDILGPFRNLFKSLRLVAMDIGNVVRLTLGLAFTFDPEKIQEKVKAFDERRQKINNEWKPIMEQADKLIGGADPILAMAIMGPAAFFRGLGVGTALVAGKTVAEVVTATNFDEIVNPFTEKLDTNQSLSRFYQEYLARQPRRPDYGFGEDSYILRQMQSQSLARRLNNFFTRREEAASAQGQTPVREQKESQERKEKLPKIDLSPDDALDMFVQTTGMNVAFTRLRRESMRNLSEVIKSIIEQLKPAQTISKLFGAKNPEEVKAAFQAIKSVNPKFDMAVYQKFSDAMEAEAKKLAEDPKFAEELKKKFPGKTLTPEELKKNAADIVFKTVKTQLDAQTKKYLSDLIKTVEGAIDDLKIDKKAFDEMKKSEYADVKDVVKVYEELNKLYNTVKSDFQRR